VVRLVLLSGSLHRALHRCAHTIRGRASRRQLVWAGCASRVPGRRCVGRHWRSCVWSKPPYLARRLALRSSRLDRMRHELSCCSLRISPHFGTMTTQGAWKSLRLAAAAMVLVAASATPAPPATVAPPNAIGLEHSAKQLHPARQAQATGQTLDKLWSDGVIRDFRDTCGTLTKDTPRAECCGLHSALGSRV
jgi:hypothetical protein